MSNALPNVAVPVAPPTATRPRRSPDDSLWRSPQEYQAFRISACERHRLAISFDPHNSPSDLVCCVEIFDPGGQTPVHVHDRATELFFVLRGEGFARLDDCCSRVRSGDTILIPPGRPHQLANAGDRRLYLLCVMSPNEGFAELIRNGVPAELDAEDFEVLQQAIAPGAAGLAASLAARP